MLIVIKKVHVLSFSYKYRAALITAYKCADLCIVCYFCVANPFSNQESKQGRYCFLGSLWASNAIARYRNTNHKLALID